jgi:hypothetical protein
MQRNVPKRHIYKDHIIQRSRYHKDGKPGYEIFHTGKETMHETEWAATLSEARALISAKF